MPVSATAVAALRQTCAELHQLAEGDSNDAEIEKAGQLVTQVEALLAELDADAETLTATFDEEQWRHLYGLLEGYVDRQYLVCLNGRWVSLVGLSAGHNFLDPEAMLTVVPTDADGDPVGGPEEFALFDDEAATVHSVHIS